MIIQGTNGPTNEENPHEDQRATDHREVEAPQVVMARRVEEDPQLEAMVPLEIQILSEVGAPQVEALQAEVPQEVGPQEEVPQALSSPLCSRKSLMPTTSPSSNWNSD